MNTYTIYIFNIGINYNNPLYCKIIKFINNLIINASNIIMG